MRIALTCPHHMFRGGGVQECVLALQDELSERGHYVKILTPQPRDYDGHIPESIITVGGSINTKAFTGSAWQWSVSVDTAVIDEVLEREKFDVMHFHEPWVPVWSRQIVQRSEAANVATMHGRFMDTMTAKTITTVVTPYTKPMIKYFDVFTGVSEPATEYFRTLSHRSVTIVPNGINIAKYNSRPSSAVRHPRKKTILFIGRLENRKGLKYLLRAYSELANRRSDVQLLIAGSGPDDKKLRTYVYENNIPRVTFLGFISEKDKIHHLHRSDVFCSPAHYGESFGIVLLEAMAASLPIVAGDNLGYQSVMRNTGALSLVNPKDTIDFARRLELFLFDLGLRQTWLKWSYPYVKQFDYQQIVDQYEDVYKQALKRYGERRA